MAYCMNCGQQLPDGAKFCYACGIAIGETGGSARKAVYDGTLHKCLNCGEILDSFATRCPSCGNELRSVSANSSISELIKKIEQATSTDEKNELITNFYVPNTREDIFDFFILAVSNLEDTTYDTDDAWRAKLEQTYHKAKISFGNTSEFEYIEKTYKQTMAKVSKRRFSTFVRKNKSTSISVILIGTGILMLVVGVVLMTLLDKNFGGSMGGMMFVVLGINFLIAPTWALDELKKKEKNAAKKRDLHINHITQSVGKDAIEFYRENYYDVIEQLKVLGFKNIEAKPEKKGLLDAEGAVKAISIAGNSEFDSDDEFEINSKIIIRYYSRNY